MPLIARSLFFVRHAFDHHSYLENIPEWSQEASFPCRVDIEPGVSLVIEEPSISRDPLIESIFSDTPAWMDHLRSRSRLANLWIDRPKGVVVIGLGNARHLLPPGAIDDAVYTFDAVAQHCPEGAAKFRKQHRIAGHSFVEGRKLTAPGPTAALGTGESDAVTAISAVLEGFGVCELQDGRIRLNLETTLPGLLAQLDRLLDTLGNPPPPNGIKIPGIRRAGKEQSTALTNQLLAGDIEGHFDHLKDDSPYPTTLASLAQEKGWDWPPSLARLKRNWFDYPHPDAPQRRTWWKALTAQKTTDRKQFFLREGVWYRVPKSTAQNVRDTLHKYLHEPPREWCGHAPKAENDWSHRAAPSEEYVFDQDFISLMGIQKLEVADLGHFEFGLVHVKPYRGSTSATSHVFTQAVSSTRAFQQHPEELIPWIDKRVPGLSKTRVVTIAILDARVNAKIDLPYLLEVSLLNALQTIEGLGFEARLVLVPVPSLRKKTKKKSC